MDEDFKKEFKELKEAVFQIRDFFYEEKAKREKLGKEDSQKIDRLIESLPPQVRAMVEPLLKMQR